MKYFYRSVSLLLFLLSIIQIAWADDPAPPPVPCKGKMINPVSDVCWDCKFPITFGSTTYQGPSWTPPDTPNPDESVCYCGEGIYRKYGIPLGYWEPMELVDVTRSPYCMVSLGGVQISSDPEQGDIKTDNSEQNYSFFQVHGYNFPIIKLLGIVTPECRQDGIFLAPNYISELDPAWSDSTEAVTFFPETAGLENTYAQLACGEDAIVANASLPQDSTYWCAGSQGIMYPFTGNIEEHIGGVQGSVLAAERLTFYLHRLDWPSLVPIPGACTIKDTNAAEVENHTCSESCQYVMPKSRYRYQMTYPYPTTGEYGCLPFGRSTMVWEAYYTNTLFNPTSAFTNTENYAYLIWRKRNCCAY